jgi:hypothetical protein
MKTINLIVSVDANTPIPPGSTWRDHTGVLDYDTTEEENSFRGISITKIHLKLEKTSEGKWVELYKDKDTKITPKKDRQEIKLPPGKDTKEEKENKNGK